MDPARKKANDGKSCTGPPIDEVAFMSNSILQTLNKKLTAIGETNKSFGGYTNIFARDFQKLEPVCSKETDLLFSTLLSMEWLQKSMPSLF
jgi:hypothetical protein